MYNVYKSYKQSGDLLGDIEKISANWRKSKIKVGFDQLGWNRGM